jgi:SpoIIAA-like
MITPYDDVADKVAAFRASGEVTAADYESVLVPAIEERLRRHQKVNLLYHLGPDFKSFTAGAMWDDAKVGFGHLAAWDRIALVSDVTWVRHMVQVMGFVIPATVRVFRDDQLPEAKRWVSEA